jgi:predicted N-acetyltransferase YhbS
MAADDVRIRRITFEDAPALERFYAQLSDDSRRARFHAVTRGISRAQASDFAAADHVGRDGFVATVNGQIVGHLMLEAVTPGTEELALAVADAAQHHGVGTLLVAAGVASARMRHVGHLIAWVNAGNAAMRALLDDLPYPLVVTWTASLARYEIRLPSLTAHPAA